MLTGIGIALHKETWRSKKIAEGLCGNCGKNPYVPDRKECESCLRKRRERQKKEYHSGRHSKTKKALADRRQRFKEKGMCVRCGKNKPKKDKLSCAICLKRQIDRQRELKDIVFKAYGGYRCNCCGESTPEFLMLDHVNNDGAKHRREVFKGRRNGTGRAMYLWIIRNQFPDIFQVLCANCNWGKKMNDGICPHKMEQFNA